MLVLYTFRFPFSLGVNRIFVSFTGFCDVFVITINKFELLPTGLSLGRGRVVVSRYPDDDPVPDDPPDGSVPDDGSVTGVPVPGDPPDGSVTVVSLLSSELYKSDLRELLL